MRIRTFVDLFAGVGGMRLAAEQLGLQCVFSSEMDPDAIRTYSENFGEIPSGDINKIKSKEIPDFDLLMAGFPCQPFSYAGKTLGFKDGRGTLFFQILRILNEKQPKVFLLENVKGLISHDQGKTLKVISKELEKSGYKIFCTILDSSDFGLPQVRERWYCVGFHKSLRVGTFKFPEVNQPNVKIRSIVMRKEKNRKLSISEKWQKRIERHFRSKQERVLHPDFQTVPGSYRSKFPIFSRLNRDMTLRFHLGDPKKSQVQEGFFASLDSLSPTIIAGRVPKLWDLKRQLNIRECARLQGFPDNFKFPVKEAKAYQQIGNAVSVPVVKKIVKEIIEAFRIEGQERISKREDSERRTAA